MLLTTLVDNLRQGRYVIVVVCLFAQYDGIYLQNGDRIATIDMWRHFTLYIDEQMSFESQSRSCAKVCYYHLRRIRQIRKYIDDEAVRSLVHAFVTSRLDYCNSLCANCSVSTRERLQRVQNCAARLVADVPRRASSRSLPQQLHWLPVEARIT